MTPRQAVTVATAILPADLIDRLGATFALNPPPSHPMPTAEAVADAGQRGAQALLVSVQNHLDAAAIDALPDSLRIIATVSVGTDHIDLDAATRRGIAVSNTPGVLDACNADLTWLLILGAARRANEAMDFIRRGTALCPLLGTRVSGRSLGIWGMGRIGREVARRAAGFGMQVLYHNRNRLPPEDEQGALFCPDRETFLARSQILTLHMPASAASDGIIDAAVFAALPRGAIFVNAARGSLVDEEALFTALDRGHLAGAGLDVFRNEPDIDPRFATHPNIFALPHIGSATSETRRAMAALAIANIEAVLGGNPPLTPVVG